MTTMYAHIPGWFITLVAIIVLAVTVMLSVAVYQRANANSVVIKQLETNIGK